MLRNAPSLLLLVLLAAALVLPGPAGAAKQDTLVFGIISTSSEENLRRQWGPVLDDMRKTLGMKVEPFFAPDYEGIITAMRTGRVQLAWFGNKSALEAVDHAGGEVFAQGVYADGSLGYHSLLIAHRDSPLKSLDDVLKHARRLSFGNGDPNSTSGFLVPGYYVFAKNKVTPQQIFRSVRSANHESNALDVAAKRVDVATCNDRALERLAASHPDKRAQIKIVWTSPLIPASALVWRADLKEADKTRIRDFFLRYGTRGETALARLEMSGFRASSNDLLLTIRQLELFKKRSDIKADPSLPRAEKAKRLAEIDARLDVLQRQSAQQP